MSVDLSPENLQFLDLVVSQGTYSDRKEALDEAVELLRKQERLRQEINEGMVGDPIPVEEVFRHLEARVAEIEKRIQ